MIIPTKKSWLWLGADRQIPSCRALLNLKAPETFSFEVFKPSDKFEVCGELTVCSKIYNAY